MSVCRSIRSDGGTTGSGTVDPPWNFPRCNGNWNGRTEGIGGGVCTGNTSVTAAVNNGFVGSGTDGGHGGNNANSPLDESPYTNVPLDDPGNTCQPGVVRINGKNEVNVAVYHRLLHERARARDHLVEEGGNPLLRHEAALQLLERLFDRWASGHGLGSKLRRRSSGHPSVSTGDVLDAFRDGAAVGSDRDVRYRR